MNKLMLKKSAAISAIILILGTTTVFANGSKDSDETDFDYQRQGNPQNKSKMGQMNTPHNSKREDMHFAVMGTVTSITEDSLTVENADGDIISVSINPLTKIVQAPTEEEKAEMRAERAKLRDEKKEARKKGNADLPKPSEANLLKENIIPLSDITVGNWITVNSFNTETITLEASRICLISEQ